MSDFNFGLLCGFWLFMIFEWLIINFVYLSNCDLFLDLILFKNKKDKLIKTCVDRYNKRWC